MHVIHNNQTTILMFWDVAGINFPLHSENSIVALIPQMGNETKNMKMVYYASAKRWGHMYLGVNRFEFDYTDSMFRLCTQAYGKKWLLPCERGKDI